VFSFADIKVSGNRLTLRQISEPLSGSSSATAANLYPFGTDLNGKRLNDPIPDTVFDPATRSVISAPEIGTTALLDAFTLARPDVEDSIETSLSASGPVPVGDNFEYTLKVIVTLGRLAPNDTDTVIVAVNVISKGHLHARAEIRSGTALPVGVESKEPDEGSDN
jgi:hypothetical protein